jgi:hypothetical protein
MAPKKSQSKQADIKQVQADIDKMKANEIKKIAPVVAARLLKLCSDITKSQCFVNFARFGFTDKQIVQLQRVNRFLYKRVAHWVRFIKTMPKIRLSEAVCSSSKSTVVFGFPTAAMIA